MEQFLSSQEWWPNLPWGLMAALALVFMAGQLIQDLANSDSWLRHNIRVLRRFGRFSTVGKDKKYFDLGENYGGQQTYIRVYLPYIFEKKTEVDAIRITGWKFRYGGSGITNFIGKYTWKYRENSTYLKNDSIEIPLAFIPESFAHPGVYGDKQPEGRQFGTNGAHLIRTEIMRDKRVQTKDVLVIMPDERVTWTRPEVLNTGNRFLVFDRDETLFPTPPKD